VNRDEDPPPWLLISIMFLVVSGVIVIAMVCR
jgi:hypothetical protein